MKELSIIKYEILLITLLSIMHQMDTKIHRPRISILINDTRL